MFNLIQCTVCICHCALECCLRVTQAQAQCHTGTGTVSHGNKHSVTVSHGLHTNDIRRIVLILCWYLADCALIIVNVLLCVLCFMFVFVLLCIELLCSPIVPSKYCTDLYFVFVLILRGYLGDCASIVKPY